MAEKKPIASDNADDVVEYNPDFSLKEKVGINIKDILTSEVIADSQEVINTGRKDFLQWIDNDLITLETAYAKLAKNPEGGRESALEIQKAAFSCKAQAGTFGFDLGSIIAKSLYDFLEKDYVEGDTNHLIIIRKHIDTLNTIFHHGIEGDGGKLGMDIHGALGKLIAKFDVS